MKLEILLETFSKKEFGEALKKANPFFSINKEILRHGEFLYRGMKSDIKNYEEFQSEKTPRAPVDTPLKYHKIADEAFQETFGFKYRSFGKFAIKSLSGSTHYGTPYVFIPQGDYQICHSDKVTDLFGTFFNGDDTVSALSLLYRSVSDDDTFIQLLKDYQLVTDEEAEGIVSALTSSETDFIVSQLMKARKQGFLSTYDKAYHDLSPNYIHFFKEQLFVAAKYKETQEIENIFTYSEVMVKCDSYLLINRDFLKSNEFANRIFANAINSA